MNTSKLKKFATEARNKLRQGVSNRLVTLGFNEAGVPIESPKLVSGGAIWKEKPCTEAFYRGFTALEEQIRKYGVNHVVEEAAYTWFNRLMAIRILTMNNLCEPVLRYVGSTRTPLIVDEARQGNLPDTDEENRKALLQLLDDDTKTADQFAMLIVAFCHNTPLIAKCFSLGGGAPSPLKSDFTEILFPSNILQSDGFIDSLNSTDFISEEDYKSSELLGWLYQFYISEKKDQVFAKKGKYDADDIPAATQIFTPNWIVKYMVQNTILPQLMPEEKIDREKYRYFVPSPDLKPNASSLKPKDLEEMRVADLACGSGHILNECFDLLYDLYISEGYTRREAIECIFTKNLTGIDIDTRAKQLATFALMLKACQRDASLVDASLMPHVYSWGDWGDWEEARPRASYPEELAKCYDILKDAEVLGSIIKFDISDSTRRILQESIDEDCEARGRASSQLILAMTDKYDAIVMNPPYMPTNKIDTLSKYVNEHYKEGKADMFAVFMMVCMDRLKEGGRMGMINMQSWMFLSSFESLRELFLKEYTLSSMLHLGPRTFDELSGEVVQNTVFNWEKARPRASSCGVYYRLVDGKNCAEKERMFLDGKNRYMVLQNNFDKIPGVPIAYWLNNKLIDKFSRGKIGDISLSRSGFSTGNNDKYIRLWYEVSHKDIKFDSLDLDDYYKSGKTFIPFTAGGSFQKWYGNLFSVVDWTDTSCMHRPRTTYYNLYCKKGLTWNEVTSDSFSCREYPSGILFEHSGVSMFVNEGVNQDYIHGFLNSKVLPIYLEALNPTLHNGAEIIAKIPFSLREDYEIPKLVSKNISISKSDWDAHETSWDFQENELIKLIKQGVGSERGAGARLLPVMQQYKQKWESLFMKLHANEEELNRRFIEIYGLQDELTPDVPLNEITILQQGEISWEEARPRASQEHSGFLRKNDEIKIHGSKLPHWNQDDTFVFITFRLGDSLPKEKRDEWKTKREYWLKSHPMPWDSSTEKEYHKTFSHKMEEWLDNGYGCCILRKPDVLSVVLDTMKYDDGKKYDLIDYVIMPNHVHVMVKLIGDTKIETIMQAWKSVSSHKLSKQLGSDWCGWMENYFDRTIRNEEHYNNVIGYIYKNYSNGGIKIGGAIYNSEARGRASSQLIWHPDVVIKQFISYAVGCMMGRYRLDRPGLAIAHPNETPEEVAAYPLMNNEYRIMNNGADAPNPDGSYKLYDKRYSLNDSYKLYDIRYTLEKFWIDTDGIIPLLPEDCGFHDNAANRMAAFVRQVLGEESQTENLNFIEECLGKSIEQYFMKDFWKDHKKMYQNRPIYWLFASKKGAFQVLVYVHRMNVATVERIRSRYLLPYIERLKKRIEDLQANESTLSTKQRNQLKTLRAQVDECGEYHNRLAVIAERGIVPDLDAGIPANHALFGDVVTKLK